MNSEPLGLGSGLSSASIWSAVLKGKLNEKAGGVAVRLRVWAS